MELAARSIASLGLLSLVVGCASTAAPGRVDAPKPRWEVGTVGGMTLGSGKPANDMITYGAFARARLDGDWAVRFTLDRLDYDFERPAKALGIQQDPSVETIDAKASATGLGAWIERTYGESNEWFVGAGLGVWTVDVDDADGPVAGGGTFDISTDAGTEFTLSADAGYRRWLTSTIAVEALLRASHHFADWKLEDNVSGATGTIDDYFTWSALFGISFGF